MATVDNLTIEITANADKAAQGMAKLANALSAVKTAANFGTNLEKTANGFKNLTDALGSIHGNKINSIAGKITSLGAALSSISTSRINLEKVGKGVTALVESTSSITSESTARLRELSDALQGFRGIDLSGLARISRRKTTPTVPGGAKESDVSNVGSRIRNVSDSINEVDKSSSSASKSTDRFRAALSNLSKVAAQSALRTIAAPFNMLKGAISSVISPIRNFIKSIGRIALYRAIRSGIKTIAAGIKEGVQNLAMFSKLRNEMDTHNANRVMSLYVSNFLYLKNALATAVIPVLKMLEPIITSITNKMVDFINVLAQLFSFMSGSSTFTKAKYYYQDYADSLDKASGSAGKLNKQLAKFDEINNLTTNQGGGSGKELPDYLEMFEDPVPIADWVKNLKDMDFEELGQTIAKKIKGALDSIDWAEVYGKSMKLGKNFASFLNGLIDPETFHSFGKTIAGGIMTAISFAFSFGDEFDFENLGLAIAEGVNGFFEEFDGGKLADTIDVWVQGVAKTFKTIVSKIKWSEVFKDAIDFFTNFDVDTMEITVGAIAFSITASVVSTALKTAISNALGESVLALPAIAVGFSGGLLIGNGAGQIISYLSGDMESYETYRQQNPFTSDSEFGKANDSFWNDIFDFWSSDKVNTAVLNIMTLGGTSVDFWEKYNKTVKGAKIVWNEEWKPSLEKFGADWEEFWFNIFDFYSGIIDKIKELWTDTIEFWKDPLKNSGLEDILFNVYNGINSKLSAYNSTKKSSSFDNVPDSVKKQLGLTETTEPFVGLGENIIKGIKKGIDNQLGKTKFGNILKTFFDGICKVFGIQSPAKEMYPIGENIILGIFEGFSLVDFAAKMTEWWNTNVAPWFTVERWLGIANNIKTAISTKWNETKTQWVTNLTNWWTNNVAPWFTLDRWKSIADNIRGGIVAKWNELVLWFNGNVGKILSKAKEILSFANFNAIGENIRKGIENPFSTAITTMTSLWNKLKDLVSGGLSMSVKINADTSGFNSAMEGMSTVTEDATKILEGLKTAVDETKKKTSPTSTKKAPGTYTVLKKSAAGMPTFASGGYPLQGSLFIAGEAGAELVGNINGRTGVANNDQITEAMYSATYDAMSKALSENGIGVTIEGDVDNMFRVVRKKANEYTRMTGQPAF